jgi:hypothetical protein
MLNGNADLTKQSWNIHDLSTNLSEENARRTPPNLYRLKKSQPALTMPLVEPNPVEFILYMVVVLQAETRKPTTLPR